MKAEAEDRVASERVDGGDPTPPEGNAAASFGAVLGAGVGLFDALRRVAATLAVLLVAEAQVARASVALVFIASIALVAFAVSLWACVVALIGWALTHATGSLGIALAILVALHVVLVIAIWMVIQRAMHHASFPHARAEFGALRGTLAGDLRKFQQAAAPPTSKQENAS